MTGQQSRIVCAKGDRVVHLGLGLRGKHGEVTSVRRQLACVRFDEVGCVLVLAADAHPIPRRPRPDF